MILFLLNTSAAGGKLEQALEKLVDFGMDAGKDILIAILIYVIPSRSSLYITQKIELIIYNSFHLSRI